MSKPPRCVCPDPALHLALAKAGGQTEIDPAHCVKFEWQQVEAAPNSYDMLLLTERDGLRAQLAELARDPSKLLPSMIELRGFTAEGEHQLCGLVHGPGNCPIARADSFMSRAAEQLRWVRQTVHQAHHAGPIEECKISTCLAITDIVGDKKW